MNKYRVVYVDALNHRNNIDYGIVNAQSEIQAIEEIVQHDTIRSVYDIDTEIEKRHNGMVAEEIKPKQEPINYTQKLPDTIQEQDYIYYGATFKYKNYEDGFIPLFQPIHDLSVDGELPISFSLNFTKEMMAEWITLCNMQLKQTNEQDNE